MDSPFLRHFVAGEWVDAPAVDSDINPARPDEVVAMVPSDEDGVLLRTAIEAARASLPEWSRRPTLERAEILYRASALVQERSDQLGVELCREEGKTLDEATGEVRRAAVILRYFAGRASEPIGEIYGSAMAGTRAITLRQPVGVIGVITPWNFPIAIPAWKIAPALAYGNTVVFKPAEATPMLALRLVEALVEAGLPPGVLNLVFATGEVTGRTMIGSDGVNAISFTGSNPVGRSLQLKAAAAHAKIQLELGGKNAVVVAPDADLDMAARHIARGAFAASGQKCTATSRVIAIGSAYQPLRDLLSQHVHELRAGDPLDPATTLAPLINDAAVARVAALVASARAAGARLAAETTTPNRGAFHPAVLLDDVTATAPIAQQEVFGPVVAMFPADDLGEAIALHNAVDYGLSGSIFSHDSQTIHTFVEAARAGVVHVNGPTTGGEPHLPFGGMGASSSWSREQGHEAEAFYTQTKTAYFEALPAAGPFDSAAG